MYRRFLPLIVIVSFPLFCWADVPAPPVNQRIGMLDTMSIENVTEADCRECHASGVPDRHHMLMNGMVPAGSLVPFPDSNGDGSPDTNYGCLNCHDQNFTVVRDCVACHTQSPHHTTPAAVDRNCVACHGDYVDNFDDGHYIPTYAASLVTPWQGLNGDGYANFPYPTPDLASDGLGTVVPDNLKQTEAGPPNFSVNGTPLETVHTRKQPNVLFYKPAGFNNDFLIGSTHHGGEQYSVVFTEGSPLAASWDAGTQTLSVTVAPTQTAQALVKAINDATGEVDVEAALGYDGEDPVKDLLDPEHYEPIGGDPPNNRGFGAGSCSYCHDQDGTLDANGDPAPVLIQNNHDTHHSIGLPFFVSDGAGGSWSKCNLCHNYTDRAKPDESTYHDQSGPAFNLHIRICEECHGPDSLHNIQTDSGNDGIVVGGEEAGYGHVGHNDDCWGCHGFSQAGAPNAGPVIPTIYTSDAKVIVAGTETVVILDGSAFTNIAMGALYEPDVALTAADGSSVTLSSDIIIGQEALAVTIPGDTAPGNYNLQVVKADDNDSNVKSNPIVISIIPKVTISRAINSRGTVSISGHGFSDYLQGSGTAVTGTIMDMKSKKSRKVTATVISWSDTRIKATFRASPDEVTVHSIFGTDTLKVGGLKALPSRLKILPRRIR